MGAFWKHVGMGFVHIGSGSAKVAIWLSQHPQVIAGIGGIAQVAGAPPVVGQVIGGVVAIDNSLEGK